MSARGATEILRRASILAAHLSSNRHATIFCFHGIEATEPVASGSAHVSLRQFRDTIDVACAVAEPVSLRDLIERHRTGRSTAGLFAVTFDDAYASIATPDVRGILHRGRVPVTVFVVTDASTSGAAFWWDRVEAVHRIATADAWAEFERSLGIPHAYRTAAAAAFGPLRPLRQWLLEHHAGRWPRTAEASLATLEAAAGARPAPQLQRAMVFDELDAMMDDAADGSGVDIGVHTATHPVLSLLTDDEVRHEIGASFATLRARWPSALPWLATPFGLYDDRTARLAREAGVEGFLSLQAYSLAHASPLHGFPRVNIAENAPPWKAAVRLSGLARLVWRLPSGPLPYPPRPERD